MPSDLKNQNILVVDDDPSIRESLKEILSFEGYTCQAAADGKDALEKLKKNSIDLMLLDLRLPRIDGLEVLKKSISLHPEIPVVMISGQGTIQLAVEATKIGAYDFLEKPLEAERTLLTIKNALEKSNLKNQRDLLLKQTREKYRMIGTDPKIKEVFSLIDQAVRVDSKVLIYGESGTGKEMVARAIHLNSKRNKYSFIPVNCSAIPESLIESELFGHMKGAFTSAISDREGKFLQANHGILFLDEIGDMSLMMQAKILRAIEDGLIEPIGSKQSIPVDVRIVAATNKGLKLEIENGNFREDLFYRLNVIPISLPQLRARKQDIKLLAEAFIQEFCLENGFPQKTFTQNVWPFLEDYLWPGNVRELKNFIERIAVTNNENSIDLSHVLETMKYQNSHSAIEKTKNTLRDARSEFEKNYIYQTLAEHDGKIIETAKALGIQRSHLWKKMKQYNIPSEI